MARIFVGIPMHKGEVSATTMTSVSQGSSSQHLVNYQLLGLSLLAKNFNLLFISAIKKEYDYFILHHSDLGVGGCLTDTKGSWTDLLVQRMTKLNAAALSAAIAIKSQNGLTSTGILAVDGDAYSLRRTTVKELDKLPAEFIDRADLCELYGLDEKKAGALLVNSGLLIMDIRDRGGIWREKKWPGFNIYDEIRWNTKGMPESYTIPEDWGLSIWMYTNGVPYFATKELVVCHCGAGNFTNAGGWGTDEHDGPRQQMHPDEYEKS